MSVEKPSGHEAQRVRTGLDRERPGRRSQPGKAVVDGLAAGQRIARMQGERFAQRRSARPEVIEHRVVVVRHILRTADLGESVRHESGEAELAYAALKLASGGVGILHR